MKTLITLLSLAALPAQASTLVCQPEAALAPRFELRLELNATPAYANLYVGGKAFSYELAETVNAGVYRYETEGLALAFRGSAAWAELVTLADGSKVTGVSLSCVRVTEGTIPGATMSDMIQLMGAEESAPALEVPPTETLKRIGAPVEAIAYVLPGSERPSREFRKTPPCPTAPGSRVYLPHGFGAPRSR
jgi:hypothetical protein